MVAVRTHTFTFALLVSLAVHGGALWLIDQAIDRRHLHSRTIESKPVAIMLPEELTLGLAEPAPRMRTWMGFEDPSPHQVAPAEVEQAAFADQDAKPQATTPPPRAPASPLRDAARMLRNFQKQLASTAGRAARTPERLNESIESSAAEPTPAEPAPEPQDAAPRQATVEAPAADGSPADKESIASSIVEVPPDQWRLGRPMAAHGLELKPRRPTITVLTMMTAAPGNPLCRIAFDRSGVPRAAAIVESCGDRRVDDAILASLYRWRASGEELERLEGERTLDITIRLLLTRRRAV